MGLATITVTGTYKDAGGNPLKGKTLKFKPLAVFGDGGVIVPLTEVREVTDATTAAFSVDLLTSDVAGAYVRYQVTFHDQSKKKFDLTDDSATISLEDLINAYDGSQAASVAVSILDHEARIDDLEAAIASGVADGDKGDITVSGGGTVWNIDAGAVGNTEVAAGIDAAKIADGTVSNAEFQFLNGVTSNIQDQLNAGGGVSAWGDIGGTLSNQTDLQAALDAKADDAHTHAISDVTGLQTALDGKASSLGADDNYVTDAEKTKLSNISVTQAVNLDTMESDIALKANDADVVHDTTDETIAGVKTFSSSPIVPTPTTDFQASTKKYVDDAIVGGGGYTDEQAQDAVGAMVDATLTYTDATPLLKVADGGVGTTQLANDAVTNTKAANMAANTIKGRITASTGDPEDLTAANVRTIINVADGATANDTDANLKNRANHTGTQTASTISDFNSAALAAAPAETVNTVGALLNGAAAATPNDTDIVATAESSVLKKITLTNFKAFLKSYFDTLYAAVLGADDNYVTDAEKVKLGNLSGTNTGDQTSIVGITGTVAQFNTAITDGDLATGGGTATGTNTGDQTSIVGITGTLAQFNTAVTDADLIPAITSDITYYVCPSGQTTANYDNDGLNTSVTPSDSNDGLTKATPLATIAAAVAKFAGKVVAAKVKIQLADCDAGKAYFPDEVDISNVCFGANSSTILERALGDRLDTYPLGYIHINGNNTTPNNVVCTGAATAAGTTSTKDCAFLVRNSILRISGMQINYFRMVGGAASGDTGAINAYRSVVFAETLNCTSDHTANNGTLVSGFFHSVICLGGTFNITNSQFVRANAGSMWQTYSPLGYASATCSHSGSALGMMMTNEYSHGFFQGGTWTFTGSGTYYAQSAWTNSSINWNADTTTSITYNGANITGLFAAQGSKIWEGAGANMTVTLTSILRRAHARSGSYIHYGGTTAGTSADLADGNSTIANGSFPFITKLTSPITAYQDYNEISAPATPAGNAVRLYAKDKAGVSELFYKNDAGTERDLSSAGGSTSPGGSDGQVQYNNGGSFGGEANFTYDDTNDTVNIGAPNNSLNFRLAVKGDGGFDGALFINEGNSMLMRQEVYSSTQAFHNPQFAAIRGRGTIASPAAVVNNDALFTIDISGQETSTTQNTAARIAVYADGTPGTNDMPGRIEFGTTADGAASPTTRMIINSRGLTNLYSGGAVASAATITPTGNLFHVTGTTTITSVSGTGVTAGTQITIIFDGALTFTDGSNLKLAGNFVTTADDTITLYYDGTNWYEVCRSVN